MRAGERIAFLNHLLLTYEDREIVGIIVEFLRILKGIGFLKTRSVVVVGECMHIILRIRYE